MTSVTVPLLALVSVVGSFALCIFLWKTGAFDGLIALIGGKVAAPAASPVQAPPTSSHPSPAATTPTEPPYCPDGSGRCTSDEYPVVPPVGYPPGCKKGQISASAYERYQNFQQVKISIPIFGPLINGMSQCVGGAATRKPTQGASAALQSATWRLKQATAVWQDAYTNYLNMAAPIVLRASKDLFAQDGFINVTAEYAALPLVQAAHLLIAPMIGLLLISIVLVWAV